MPDFFSRSTGDDGLTHRERKQRAKNYFNTAGRKSSTADMDALEARMKARHEAGTRHTEV
jgi:hypothetical protein